MGESELTHRIRRRPGAVAAPTCYIPWMRLVILIAAVSPLACELREPNVTLRVNDPTGVINPGDVLSFEFDSGVVAQRNVESELPVSIVLTGREGALDLRVAALRAGVEVAAGQTVLELTPSGGDAEVVLLASCTLDTDCPSVPPRNAAAWSCQAERCVAARCGDSVVTVSFEECDDGGNVSADGCTADCRVETGFDCRTGACLPICGDGILVGDEECDLADSNNDPCDGCRDCRSVANSCGDGVLCAALGETCDNGPLNDDTLPDRCRASSCEPAGCGDGVRDSDEECDDGMQCSQFGPACRSDADCSSGERCERWSNDGCSDTCGLELRASCVAGPPEECSFSCGDGFADGQEECDEGGESVACNVDCTADQCGDAKINVTAGEECDPGDGGFDDGPCIQCCRSSCLRQGCGDGVVDENEICETDGTDSCLDCVVFGAFPFFGTTSSILLGTPEGDRLFYDLRTRDDGSCGDDESAIVRDIGVYGKVADASRYLGEMDRIFDVSGDGTAIIGGPSNCGQDGELSMQDSVARVGFRDQHSGSSDAWIATAMIAGERRGAYAFLNAGSLYVRPYTGVGTLADPVVVNQVTIGEYGGVDLDYSSDGILWVFFSGEGATAPQGIYYRSRDATGWRTDVLPLFADPLADEEQPRVLPAGPEELLLFYVAGSALHVVALDSSSSSLVSTTLDVIEPIDSTYWSAKQPGSRGFAVTYSRDGVVFVQRYSESGTRLRTEEVFSAAVWPAQVTYRDDGSLLLAWTRSRREAEYRP